MWAELSNEGWMWLMIMVVGGGWIVPATASGIAKHLRKAREFEQVTALKHSMIERGMSAEEIERVINAGTPPKGVAEEDASAAHEQG